MKVLIKNATTHAPLQPYDRTRTDILIIDGKIEKTGTAISVDDATTIIESEDLHVSAGWMDCFADFSDPGEEYKENIESGCNAAAAGGYTDIMLVPNTDPPITGKSQVEYIMQKAKGTPLNIWPIGAITQKIEGKELTEMYDMKSAGALAFSDGWSPVQSSGILQKALEYVMAVNATIIQLPDDKSIGSFGQMNEGIVSTRIGLAGKPALSEELMVARDIELVRYTNSKLHFTGISTKKSVELISAAKREGLRVSCSVTPYHLFFCDDDLQGYDTNLKVNPPLRTKEDRAALIEAVQSGVVDFIASHHRPQDYDHKVCEFSNAKNGMETLETVFGAVLSTGISLDQFIKMQTQNIQNIFNIERPAIKEGNDAKITLFDPNVSYTFTENHIHSLSKNNAFAGKNLRGKVIGIINKDRLFLNQKS